MEPRAYQSDAAGTPPAYPASPSIGYAQDATISTPATEPGPNWFFMVGEELRNVILAGKLGPDPYKLTQVRDAILAIRKQYNPDTPPAVDFTLTAPEAYWSQTVFLAHLTGANGAQLFPDSSQYANTPTVINSVAGSNPVTSTAVPGPATGQTSSGSFQYDANPLAGPAITYPPLSAYALGTHDFDLEFAVYWPGAVPTSSNLYFFGQKTAPGHVGEGAAAEGSFYVNSSFGGFSPNISLNYTSAGLEQDSTFYLNSLADQLTPNAWHRICIERHGNVLSIYIDGVLNSSNAFTDSIDASSDVLTIGAPFYPGIGRTNSLFGYMAEIRMTIGVARYGAAYTPQAAPFSQFNPNASGGGSSPVSGPHPLFVQFTDASTHATPSAWFWNFGDGNFSTLQNPGHTYAASGTYEVGLTIVVNGVNYTINKLNEVVVT